MTKPVISGWSLQAPHSAVILLLVTLCNFPALAQQTDSFDYAMDLFKSGHFAEAAEALSVVTASDPKRARDFLLRASMITMQRRAASITLDEAA